MEPMTMLAIGSGIASLAGGLIGGSKASAEAEKAMALLDSAMERIRNLNVPDTTKEIIYQQFMSVGDFTPQQLNKTIEENAPLALITEDPKNRLRQESTFNQVQQLTQTGLGAQDKLAMEQARRQASQDALSKMASIESEAKRRGQFGGGQALALKAQAAQSSADRQAMENMQAAANASQNRQAALKNAYEMASGMRATDLGTEEKNVSARNLRDEMMMKYASNRELQNKSWQEEANRARRESMQQASDKNVARSQAESLRRFHEAPMEQFRLNMSKEQALANLMQGKANAHSALGGAKAQMWSQIGSGVGGAMMGGAGLMASGNQTAALNRIADNQFAGGSTILPSQLGFKDFSKIG